MSIIPPEEQRGDPTRPRHGTGGYEEPHRKSFQATSEPLEPIHDKCAEKDAEIAAVRKQSKENAEVANSFLMERNAARKERDELRDELDKAREALKEIQSFNPLGKWKDQSDIAQEALKQIGEK